MVLECQVGSVEQLQGQEKRVIIISTVRSDPTYLEHDFKHKLGFVASAKRFNVAITRAQVRVLSRATGKVWHQQGAELLKWQA